MDFSAAIIVKGMIMIFCCCFLPTGSFEFSIYLAFMTGVFILKTISTVTFTIILFIYLFIYLSIYLFICLLKCINSGIQLYNK